jgi:hypothetical protein
MSKSKRSLIGAVEFPERSWKNRDTTKDATKVMTKVTTKVMTRVTDKVTTNAPFEVGLTPELALKLSFHHT